MDLESALENTNPTHFLLKGRDKTNCLDVRWERRDARAMQPWHDLDSRMGKGLNPTPPQLVWRPKNPLSTLMAPSTTWSACLPLGLRPHPVPSGPLPLPTAAASNIWEPGAATNHCGFVWDYQHVGVYVWCVHVSLGLYHWLCLHV